MIRFKIPTPASSKNSRMLVTIGGRPRSIKNAKARASAADVIEAAANAMRMAAARRIDDDDVRVTIVYDVESETCAVEVASIGPRPKGRTGRRRDVANLPEVVLDALQGIAYGNDNQVADLRVVRRAIPAKAK